MAKDGIDYELMTLENARKLLGTDLSKSDLYVLIGKTENNKVVIPIEMINLICGSAGVIRDQDEVLKASFDSSGGATAYITPSETEISEILTIQASCKVDATVADRSFTMRLPDLGMGGLAGSNPTSFITAYTITLSASQYGYYVKMGNYINVQTIDNGAVTNQSDTVSLPLRLGPGADIHTLISVNGQPGDVNGLDILYKIVGGAP